jgi:hypothetical protein
MDYVHFSKIKLWKDNPRINDHAVPRLMELLKIHGQKTRIGAWTKNSVIYKGNTTFKALCRLMKEWKVIAQGESNELFQQLKNGLIKIDWMSFPDELAAIAYAIADNKSSEFAVWDDKILDKLMTPRMIQYPASLGFDEKEIAAIKNNLLKSGLQTDIGEYNPDDDTFVIKILDVNSADKEAVLKAVNTILKVKGYTYVADAY